MQDSSATTLFPEMSEFEDDTAGSRTAAPLADRMRPRTLSEFVGQEHLVGEGRVLRRLIEGGSTWDEVVALAQAVEAAGAAQGLVDIGQVVGRAHDHARLEAAGIPVVERIDQIPDAVKDKLGAKAGA